MRLDELYSGPGVGFEAPMAMLAACHDRVRRTLDLIVRLQSHLAAQGVTDQARSAATDILRYFDIAGPSHHEDEARHVLPRLRESGLPDLQALADRLHDDHDAMQQDWQLLRNTLIAIRDGGTPVWPTDLAHRYVSRYRAHLALEEQVAFPAASHGLDAADEAAMGREMAQRRLG
ncbi:hemerythrin domain-containing protein [Roseateles amylovorans]|uniref:Hemerythrin domain-containing protein n=1 Tax=Roseateles amylovorans TaxID=2978473 RepID=A0ABY6AV93_9BURK|nr:hemerythrin domain-containing protein [Roseateles amylovorans]UXH76500.1 hemerythrin domain-containing protein [Roseateles amylovorans]